MYLDLHRDAATAVRRRQRPGWDGMMKGPDFAEGVAALAERRPPRSPIPSPGPTGAGA